MALVGFWILMLFAGWQFYNAWRESRKVSPAAPWTAIFPTATNRAKPEFRKMWTHYGIGCAVVFLGLVYALLFVPGFEF